jgi:hypothetical protein
VREIEVKRNNEILGDKIINIFAIKNNKKFKPLYDLKKNKQTSINKYFTSRVEQDNQQMLKRLVDLPSNYNKKLWYKDFEKAQEYKKNICVFPSIKFYKDKDKENEYERNLHSSQQKNINTININNDPNNNINNHGSNIYMNNTNAIGFFNSNDKKRSNTSYSKFKNTEKLYNSKYFQNLHTEDSSK